MSMNKRCHFSPRDRPKGDLPWMKSCTEEVILSCGLVGNSQIQETTHVPVHKGRANQRRVCESGCHSPVKRDEGCGRAPWLTGRAMLIREQNRGRQTGGAAWAWYTQGQGGSTCSLCWCVHQAALEAHRSCWGFAAALPNTVDRFYTVLTCEPYKHTTYYKNTVT